MEIDIYKLVNRYQLTDTETSILKKILIDPEKSLEMSVREIASENYSSPATVVKLAKKMGYTGYTDMVYRLYFMQKNLNNKDENSLSSIFNSDLFSEISEISVETFVDLLAVAKKQNLRIYLTGSGFSKTIAEYICMKLLVNGFDCIFTDLFAVYEQESDREAIVVLISQSGETGNIIKIAQRAKKNNHTIVLFTGEKETTLTDLADVSFIIKNDYLLNDQNKNQNYFYSACLFFFEYLNSRATN